MPEDASRNPRHLRIKALGKQRPLVGHAVSIAVFQPVNPLGMHGQVLPVDRAVSIVVFEAPFRLEHLPGASTSW